MSSVKIYDGKYEFYEDERGMLMCKRHGESWRDFVGDKAVHGLFSYARDLEEKVHELTMAATATTDADAWIDAKDEWSEAIHEAHPTRSGSHEQYGTAMKMVTNRYSKGAIVSLINWLLVEREKAVERALVNTDVSALPEYVAMKERVEKLEARLRVIPCLVRDIDKLRDRDEVIAIARGDEPPPTDKQLAMRGLNPDER
jgi:hypothetical protein